MSNLDFTDAGYRAAAIANGTFTGVADISPEEYHASPGLSYSSLKQFATSPAHYQAYLRKEHEREYLGTGTHMRTLERDRFDRIHTVIKDRRGKRADEAKELEAAGRFVVNESEYESICRMSDAITSDADCRALLCSGKAEQSVFWKDPATGLLLRCRPDWLRDDGVMVDLKYFNSVDPREVEKQVWRMRYHWQSAFYLDGGKAALGVNHSFFAHIIVTDADPFVARPFVLVDACLEKARLEYRPLLEKYSECKRTNHWPAFERPSTGITEIALPDYAW